MSASRGPKRTFLDSYSVSNGTKRNYCRAIQRAMRWAEEQGYIESSPIIRQHPNGKLFRITQGRAWTPSAVNCMFERIKGKPAGRAKANKGRRQKLDGSQMEKTMTKQQHTPDARAFLGGYLKKEDLDGPQFVTLVDVRPNEMPNSGERKLVAYFHEHTKGMVPNATNLQLLMALFQTHDYTPEHN